MDGLFDGAEVISTYTAAQAVDDGLLVEVPRSWSRKESNAVYSNDLCFSASVYITSNLYTRIETEGDDEATEVAVRLQLRYAFEAFKAGDALDLMRTSIESPSGLRVWGVIDGAGLTLMLPEDY